MSRRKAHFIDFLTFVWYSFPTIWICAVLYQQGAKEELLAFPVLGWK